MSEAAMSTEAVADATESTDVVETTETEVASHSEHYADSIVMVKNYTMASLAPAVVPLPLLDLAALAAIQMKMLNDLGELYGLEFSNDMGRGAIASLATSALPVAATPLLASFVKLIPGVGQVSGVASMLLLGGAATHALGMVFVNHFENGGTFEDFDAKAAKAYFQEEFEKGKQVAADLKDKVRPAKQEEAAAAENTAAEPAAEATAKA